MKQEIPLQNGHIYVTPHIPQEDKILFHDLKKEDQYWRRQPLPYDYDKLPKYEQVKWQDKFWEWYFEGCWFNNNGEPTYLPPKAWFFFNLWQGEFETDDGYAEMRMEQVKQFYFEDLAEEDYMCIGGFKFKQRRDGATLMRMNNQVYKAITSKRKWFGIISKTSDDAKDVCWSKLMMGFKGLPKFFKPHQAGSSDPKEKLIFDKPAIRITNKNWQERQAIEEEGQDNDYLETVLTHRATKTNAFDGLKLFDLTLDEFCKFPKDVSPKQTLSTHIRCVRQGKKKVGHIHIITSPIEVMCDAFEETVELWHNSNFDDADLYHGATKSGMWRWFSSAKMNLEGFIDKYGYCNQEAAEEFVMQERAKATTPQEKRSITLQMPLYIEEIIDTANLETIFTHDEAIKERKIYILSHPYKDNLKQERSSVYGNLEWKDALVDTKLIFVPSNNQDDFSHTGKFRFAYQPNEWEINRFIVRGDEKFPYGDSNFTIGIDPYEYRRVSGKAPSRGCAFGHKTFSFDDSSGLDNFYFEYYFRPKTPEIFCEDMIKAAVYTGAHVQFEAKNMKIADWFEDRGYWAFLMNYDLKKRNERKGNPASADLTQEMVSLIDQYFSVPEIEEKRNNFDYFWFDDVLDEMPKFDPDNTQRFDKIMALGQTLKGVQKRRLLKGNYKQDTGMIKEMIEYLVETG